MRVNEYIKCEDFPCADVRHNCYIVPDVDVKPDNISMVMISEAAPGNLRTITMPKGTLCSSKPRFKRSTTPVQTSRLYRIYSIWVCTSPLQSNAEKRGME